MRPAVIAALLMIAVLGDEAIAATRSRRSSPPRKPLGELTYAGYGLHSDIAALRRKFPGSIHTDNRENFILFFSKKTVGADRLFYIQFDRRFDRNPKGEMQRVSLSFEIPVELRPAVRPPPCSAIREQLVRQYGPAMKKREPSYEEAVRHEMLLWFNETEELTLDCMYWRAERKSSDVEVTIEARGH